MDKTKRKRRINMAAVSLAAAMLLAAGGTGVSAADKKETAYAEEDREEIGYVEINGVLFLPLTDVVKSQDGEIDFDCEQNEVTVTCGGNTVNLYIGISRFEKNGSESSRMEGAPYLDGDTLLCPAEVFTDGLDMEYELDEEKESLRIYKKKDADHEKWSGTGEAVVKEYTRIQKNVVDGFNDMVEHFTGEYLDSDDE